MNSKLVLAAALTLAALEPGIASASFVLDTGTPPATGTPSAVLNTSDWYAAEFSVTAGQTINSLSAYLTQGVGTVGDSYTWDIYSTAFNFLGGIASVQCHHSDPRSRSRHREFDIDRHRTCPRVCLCDR